MVNLDQQLVNSPNLVVQMTPNNLPKDPAVTTTPLEELLDLELQQFDHLHLHLVLDLRKEATNQLRVV